MRNLLLYLLFCTPLCWGQKMTGFWQGMLFSATDQTVVIPIYLDIFVTNGLVDGQIRIENEGVSIYPIRGTYSDQEMKLVTLNGTWFYLPEFSLSPYIYTLKFNAQTGYLEGSTDRQDYRFVAYQSSG